MLIIPQGLKKRLWFGKKPLSGERKYEIRHFFPNDDPLSFPRKNCSMMMNALDMIPACAVCTDVEGIHDDSPSEHLSFKYRNAQHYHMTEFKIRGIQQMVCPFLWFFLWYLGAPNQRSRYKDHERNI